MWRIRIDTACQKLALEVRDPDLLMAHFYTLDTAGFTLQRLNLNPSKAWWQGLDDMQYDQIYLHGYGDRKTGQHRGITAIAPENQTTRWTRDELAFYGFSEQGLLIYKADAPEEPFSILDPESGTVIASGISQQAASEQTLAFNAVRYQQCVYPVLYKEGEPYFDEVADFLKIQVGAKPVKAVEYAEANSCIIISYYEVDDTDNLHNFVTVYDLEGDLRLKVKLASGLSGIGSDTFFIFNINLYLIIDKQILQVYQI